MRRSRLIRGGGKARKSRLESFRKDTKDMVSFDRDLAAAKKAYADTWTNPPKGSVMGSPEYGAWWNKVEKQRNLEWKGTLFHTPKRWLEIAGVVGEYNKFTPKRTFDLLKDLPVTVKLAREGSVAVYVRGDPAVLDKVAKRFKDYADEIDYVKVPNVMLRKEKGYDRPMPYHMLSPEGQKTRYLRLWFD